MIDYVIQLTKDATKVSPADHEATERELQDQALAIVRELESGCEKPQP